LCDADGGRLQAYAMTDEPLLALKELEIACPNLKMFDVQVRMMFCFEVHLTPSPNMIGPVIRCVFDLTESSFSSSSPPCSAFVGRALP